MTKTALVWIVGSLLVVPQLAACDGETSEGGTGGGSTSSGTGNGGAGASSTSSGTGGGGASSSGTGGSGASSSGAPPLDYEFLIVDDDGRVLGYEADDGTLTDLPLGLSLEWYAIDIVAADNGAFMAVGGQYNSTNSAAAVYSSDGLNWTDVSPAETAAPDAWRSIAYGNGSYVAVGGGVFHSGDDGATWTAVPGIVAADVAFGDGRFVTSVGYHSTDGVSWTAPTVPIAEELSTDQVVFGAGRFVILADPYGNAPPVHYSDDGGDTWTAGTMTQHYSGFDAAVFGNGRFVAADAYYMVYSDDGATWADGTAPSTPLDMAQIGLAYHPTAGFLRVAGQYGQGEIWTSADGMTWTGTGGPMGGYWLTGVAATQ